MNLRRRYVALTEDELNAYLTAGPSDQIAFLTAKTQARALAETLAALANRDNG